MEHLIQFIKDNQLLCGLILTAIAATMPVYLPYSFKAFPQWTWTWIRDAIKTFSNLRNSASAVVEKKKDETPK